MSTPVPPEPEPAAPGRAEILAILAAFGDRPPEEVPETVDSMELAWLVHQLESRYGATVPDSSLVRMTTVTTVLDELAALAGLPGSTERGGAPADGTAGSGTGPGATGPGASTPGDTGIAAGPGAVAAGGTGGGGTRG